MQQQTRRCGNCDQGVGAADITCPHCGALLAAYEAPAGSTTGSDSAVKPVTTPEEPIAAATIVEPRPMPEPTTPVSPSPPPYRSVTAQGLASLDEERPTVGTVASSSTPDSDSPVTQALQQTRIAADLDDSELAAKPAPTPPLDAARQTLVDTLHQQVTVAAAATAKPTPRPARPAPEDRGSRSGPPVPQHTIQNANSRRKPSAQSPGVSVRAFIAVLVFLVFLSPLFRTGAFPGLLIIVIVVAGIFWYMKTVAKSTGRKSTAIPKDTNRRR